jgi:dihydroorotate dehydrogenase
MYQSLLKPLLFRFDAETAHRFTFESLKILSKLPLFDDINGGINQFSHPSLKRKIFGLEFDNPVGLAAGFDKNAELADFWATLGFGFVEIGTVTPRPQAGNPKPRLFRLPQDNAIINRMGFNNDGADEIAERLSKRKSKIIIGGNIGKNKLTENEKAFEDYRDAFLKLYPYCDYFVVNVSSPNTPNLRDLQDKEPLKNLLADLQNCNQKQVKPKPILLKIAPDLTEGQLNDILEIVPETGTAGIIATNTTVSRVNLRTDAKTLENIGAGGLSGQPLRSRSTEVLRYLHQNSGGRIPIVSVGGIMTAQDAVEKIQAGASLVQVYTGMIYQGPAFVKEIKKALVEVS